MPKRKKSADMDTSKHYEVDMKENVLKDSKRVMGAYLNPKPSRNRLKTYKPINDQDN